MAAFDALWSHLLTDIANGRREVSDGLTVIKAVTTGISDEKAGTAPNVLVSIQQKNPNAIPIIEEIASIVGTAIGQPEIGPGVKLLFTVAAMVRPMTRDDEERWFDRASSQGNT